MARLQVERGDAARLSRSSVPIEEVLAAAGFVVWPMVEFEADDGLGAAAVIAADDARVERVVICTPDKDLGQCVGGKVVQWDRRQDKWFDAAGVHGAPRRAPASVPDYLALVGDSADGFPGIPGWGSKSAAAVLDRWGHLEDIPVDPVTWDAGVRNAGRLNLALRDQFELALLFRRIATVDADAPVDAAVDDLEWRGPTADLAPMCDALDGAAAGRPRWRSLATLDAPQAERGRCRDDGEPWRRAPPRRCSRRALAGARSPRSPRRPRRSRRRSPAPPAAGAPAGVCDPIDPAHCLLPFPNDLFTVADPTTDTGRRVNLVAAGAARPTWPASRATRPSGTATTASRPGSPILTRVPGLDLHAHVGHAPATSITDLGRYRCGPTRRSCCSTPTPASGTRSGPSSTPTPTRPTPSGC